MADHFYSVVKGDGLSPGNVTAGTSTSTESIELRVHDGDGHSQVSVLLAIEALEAYITTHSVTA